MTFSTGYDWAKPGAKVVCIDGKPKGGRGVEIWPVVDQVYTIRDIFICAEEGIVKVHLSEIINIPYSKYKGYIGVPFECGFRLSRFKPLVTKELPQSLTCLLKNPKSVILPNEGNRWDVRKQPVKSR